MCGYSISYYSQRCLYLRIHTDRFIACCETSKDIFLDIVDNEVLLRWVEEQIREHEDLEISDIASVFRDGRILCAVLNHYRPDLLDYGALSAEDPAKNNQTAIDLLEKEIGRYRYDYFRFILFARFRFVSFNDRRRND